MICGTRNRTVWELKLSPERLLGLVRPCQALLGLVSDIFHFSSLFFLSDFLLFLLFCNYVDVCFSLLFYSCCFYSPGILYAIFTSYMARLLSSFHIKWFGIQQRLRLDKNCFRASYIIIITFLCFSYIFLHLSDTFIFYTVSSNSVTVLHYICVPRIKKKIKQFSVDSKVDGNVQCYCLLWHKIKFYQASFVSIQSWTL